MGNKKRTMLTFILALSAGWIVVSIVVGILLGAAMHRLDAPIGRRRSSQAWKVASATKNNGSSVLVMARITNSPARRAPRR
jgi:hypothetical protein